MSTRPQIRFAFGDCCWNCGSTLLTPTRDPDAPHGYKCARCPALPSRAKVTWAIRQWVADQGFEAAQSGDPDASEDCPSDLDSMHPDAWSWYMDGFRDGLEDARDAEIEARAYREEEIRIYGDD